MIWYRMMQVEVDKTAKLMYTHSVQLIGLSILNVYTVKRTAAVETFCKLDKGINETHFELSKYCKISETVGEICYLIFDRT